MFVAGNAIVNKLRDKDRALAEVRREAARVAEDVRHGALTGTALADDYVLGELLGRGGMGEIYAARRVSDDRQVAIKVLHRHLTDDPEILERFRREAHFMRKIPGQFTAKVLDVGRDRSLGVHFIVMELLRGEDLAAFLRRRGPLGPDDLVPLVRRIALALDKVHASGIVHRDLKPQNIFLVEKRAGAGTTQRSEIRLLDFGMSKILGGENETLTRADAVIGTLAYMSPEQALGQLDAVGPATDRFAFAAVLYRALTGRQPFNGTDLLGAIREIANVYPPPPSRLKPELHRHIDAVLVIGLAKRIEDRYESAAALVDDLEAASTGALSQATLQRAQSIHSEVGEAATMGADDPAAVS